MANDGLDAKDAAELPKDFLEALVEQIAIPVPRERLAAALSSHARTHAALMRVRSIPLQYSPTYVEPLTALRWIERGGHSVD